MVVGFDRTPAPYPGHEWLGGILALAGAAVFGAYLILVRSARAGLSTQTIVTHTYGWAAAFLVLGAAIARQPVPGLHDGGAWAAIGAMALVSQLLGHTALNASLRWFSPSAISFANLLEPVFASVLALAFFGEPVPPLAVAGGIVLLASVFVVVRDERQPAENEL